MYVFQCRWEAGEAIDSYVKQESARFNLVRGVWAGRGTHGQKVLELTTAGYPNAAEAKAGLYHELERIVSVEAPKATLGLAGFKANENHPD